MMVKRSTNDASMCTSRKASQKSFCELMGKNFVATKAKYVVLIAFALMCQGKLNAQFQIGCPSTVTVDCILNVPTYSAADLTEISNEICGLGTLDPATFNQGTAMLFSGSPDCDGAIYEIELSIFNTCGMDEECDAFIRIQNSGPTIDVCPPATTASCFADIAGIAAVGETTLSASGVTTSCGKAYTVSSSISAFTNDCNGTTYTISYTVSETGCTPPSTATCNQIVTLANAGPMITLCPAATTATCHADIATIAAAGVTALETSGVSTSCSIDYTVSSSISPFTSNCNGTAYTITYTVTESGCTSPRSVTCTQDITLANGGPVIDICPAATTASCFADIATIATAGESSLQTSGVTTSCSSGVTVSSSISAFTSNCNGTVYTITYTVTETGCTPARSASCVQSVTLANSGVAITACPTATTASCFADIAAIATSGEAALQASGVTSQCGGNFTVSSTVSAFTSNCNGTIYTITYTVTETGCTPASTATCTQDITLVNAGPMITSCPAATTASCFADIAAIAANGAATLQAGGVTTSCGFAYSVTPVISAFTSNCTGTNYTITYTVTEIGCATARTASCVQNVTLANSGLAITSCPPATTATCFADINAIAAAGVSTLQGSGVTSSCGGAFTVSSAISAFTNNCSGTVYTVTYTVTETGCTPARTATCTQSVTLSNVGPVITNCPAATTASCFSDVSTVAANGVTALQASGVTTACGNNYTVSSAISPFTSNCGGTIYTVTYTVTEIGCSPARTATCTQSITLANAAPVITLCPAQTTASCFADLTSVAAAGEAALRAGGVTVSCGSGFNVSSAISPFTSNCSGTIYSITYIVTEVGCTPARSVTCVQNVSLSNVGPAITVCPAATSASCFSDISTIAANGVAALQAGGVTTSCGSSYTVNSTISPFTSNCSGTAYTITYTVSESGCSPARTTSCTQNVTLTNSGPVITACPPTMTATCHADLASIASIGEASLISGGVTISCGSAYTVSSVISPLTNNCNGTMYSITYTVTESGCTGRSATCVQSVTLSNTGPVITACPSAVTATCYGDLGNIATIGELTLQSVGVSISCGSAYTVSSTISPFISNCSGTIYTITYTVSETGCPTSRSVSCVQNVTLVNSSSISCPATTSIEFCDMATFVPDLAVVNLPCATSPITINGVPGSFIGDCSGGRIDVLYTYSEPGCTTISQTCSVIVGVAPQTTISCTIAPGFSISACDVDSYSPPQAVVNLGCGGTTFVAGTKEPYTGGCGGGTLNITYTYVDVCGPVTKVCVVIVNPEPAATITCPTIPVVSTCNMFSFTPPDALVTLGCGGTTTTPGMVGTFMGDCTGGEVIVTYEYTNDCGTMSEPCSVTVSGDSQPPILICPGSMTNLACGTPLPTIDPSSVTVSDNCDATVVASWLKDSIAVQNTMNSGMAGNIIVRIFTATDDCGNTGRCEQVLAFVPDATPPVLSNCAAVTDIILQCGAVNMANQINNWITQNQALTAVNAMDNCTSLAAIEFGNDYSGVIPAFSCGTGNGRDVSFYADDESNNRSACTAKIIITDTVAPEASCPPAITNITCQDDVPTAALDEESFIMLGGFAMTGSGTMVATGSGTSIFDNCAPEVWILHQDDKTKDDLTFCSKVGEQKIVRTYYVTDDCGNTGSCTQDIIFNPDLTIPVVECPPLQFVSDPHVCYIDIVLPNPTATDDCSGVKNFEHDHMDTNRYPVGQTLVTWIVTDECHNESLPCVQTITVVDEQSPSIACSTDILCLPLDQAGNLVVPVESLYSSIEDNCHLLSPTTVIKVGSNVPPAQELLFDCSAVGDTSLAQVIATDQFGNSNTCTRIIVVKDVIPPFITCPAPQEVNCETPLNLADLSNFGTLSTSDATDACGVEFVFELDPEDTGYTCMTGGGAARTITRIFEAIDSSGNTDTCHQVISVRDFNPFTEDDIMWLDDVEVPCMGETSVASIGEPGIMSDACSQILIDYTDMVFDLGRDACRRIVRIWKVIDWCQFSRSNDPITGELIVTGEWVDTQFIDIVSDIPPSLNGPFPDKEICAQSCNSGRFQMTFDGTQGCADFGLFGYLFKIDLEDGRVIQSTGNNIDQELPLGTHTVTLTVKDNCHQVRTESFTVTVKDCKPPSLICINGLVVNIMDTNPPMVPLWASDFSNGTKDNCTTDENIVYSFSQDSSFTQRIFDCNEADRNLGVTIYATDEHGNQSSCRTTLMVQTNGVSCVGFLDQGGETAEGENTSEEEATSEEETHEEGVESESPESAMVSGLVTNYKGEGIMNTEVNILSADMDVFKMTSELGGYAFESLDMYKDYMITPSKNDDVLNGVSTLDLVLIQKHILGISLIEDPYLRIAADIDGSKHVSARDLVELRKLILGSIETFSNNESWRFIDASYDMEANGPWNFPEEIEYFNLDENQMSTDFVGVKIGDINGNSKTNLDNENIEVRSSNKMKLTFEDSYFDKGDNLIVSVKATNDIDLNGLQLELGVSDAIEVVDIISGTLAFTNDQYRIERNEMLISWHQEHAISLEEGDEVFKLALRAKANGNLAKAIQLSEYRLQAEAYDEALNIHDVVLDASDDSGVRFELYQNRPNPFIAGTEIEFYLPKAMKATIIAYDIKGQVLLEKTDRYSAGNNRIMITKDELGIASGVIYYRLEAGEFRDVKTMILIE